MIEIFLVGALGRTLFERKPRFPRIICLCPFTVSALRSCCRTFISRYGPGIKDNVPPHSFVVWNVHGLIGHASKSRVAQDARDEPDVPLLGGVESQHGKGLPEGTRREVGKADAQHESLRVFLELALVDLPKTIPAGSLLFRDPLGAPRGREARKELAGRILVECIEGVDQQPLTLRPPIRNRVDVGSVASAL